jgi:hypothetical protein
MYFGSYFSIFGSFWAVFVFYLEGPTELIKHDDLITSNSMSIYKVF